MGELLYALPDAGTALTNTTTETALGSVTLTAVRGSSGAQGRRVIRFAALTRTTATSGGPTLTIRLKFGGTTVHTTSAVSQLPNDVCFIEGNIIVRYDGTAVVMVQVTEPDGAPLSAQFSGAVIATVGLSPTLEITGQWNVASVSNSVQMELLNVWDSIR